MGRIKRGLDYFPMSTKLYARSDGAPNYET